MDEHPPAAGSREILEQSVGRVEKLLAELRGHRAQVEVARTLDARARDEGVRRLGDAVRSAEGMLEQLRAAIKKRDERVEEEGDEGR
jgi:hypothetical protein